MHSTQTYFTHYSTFLPTEPHLMSNVGQASLILRLAGTITAEMVQYTATLSTNTDEPTAQERMRSLATTLGAYEHEADPPMTIGMYPWIFIHAEPGRELLVNFDHWYEFRRLSVMGNYAIQGTRMQGSYILAGNLTEQQALALLLALQTCSGAVPVPF
jgi:hypothetical protein